jgi:hypothetical protein
MTEITVAGATTLGQHWPNQDRMIVGEQYWPNVGPAKTKWQLVNSCWPNIGLTKTILQLVNSCWPNVGLTKTILQLVNSCWPNVGPMLKCQRQPSTNQTNHLPTLAQRWPDVEMPMPTIYQPNQPFANVGPTHDCYLGCYFSMRWW